LLDGSGNEPLLLSLAINLVANLLRMGIPTLVCCGAGMSRSPAVVAAALARARQGNPDECLKMVTHSGSRDVSAALWEDIIRLMKKEM
jgi:protein-tyrosine phosphatase